MKCFRERFRSAPVGRNGPANAFARRLSSEMSPWAFSLGPCRAKCFRERAWKLKMLCWLAFGDHEPLRWSKRRPRIWSLARGKRTFCDQKALKLTQKGPRLLSLARGKPQSAARISPAEKSETTPCRPPLGALSLGPCRAKCFPERVRTCLEAQNALLASIWRP